MLRTTALFKRRRERATVRARAGPGAAVICIPIQFRLAYLKEKTCPSLGARTLLVNVGRAADERAGIDWAPVVGPSDKRGAARRARDCGEKYINEAP